MPQYINRNTLIAEIDRRIERAKAERVLYPNTILSAKNLLLLEDYDSLKNFINASEVKEIDLEKHLKEDIEDIFFDLDGVAVKGATSYLTVEDVKDIAKYFFELGLKTQKEK